jgi:signal transduction histidine kinase/CheY-like chemotaxis protein
LFFVERAGYLPPPLNVPDHLSWWWLCIGLLAFNIWALPMIAHVTQQRMLASLRSRNAELELTQKVLLEETEQQDAFVASVSHELRTPMNAIMGLMQTLDQRPITQGVNAKMFAAMSHSARHLLTVINDLLDFSQIQTDSLRVASRPMPLAQLLRHFESIFSPQLSERGIGFEVQIDPRVPQWALGDPDRLSQIVINLLGNATKFTRQGRVGLNAQLTPQGLLRVEVTDTGRGIAADQLDQVFERFSSLTTHTQKTYGGTGLGLSICRNLIERMGGAIGVTSALGQGSCFWFEIPVTECFAPTSATTPGQAWGAPAPTDRPTPLLRRALIVDDSLVNRLVAKQMLLSAFPGVLITEADNGLRALESLREQPVDLVLMDVIMPVMDGIEATQRLGEMLTPAPPVIGLTADVTEGVETRCKQAGMVSVLTKPYERQVLIQRVEQALHAAGVAP